MLYLLIGTRVYDLLNCHPGSKRLPTRINGELAAFKRLWKSFAVEKPVLRHC